jgi:hypothetical protein
LYAQFADALIAFTSASSGKQIESYYSTFCVMRAAFNLTGDEKNSEFVTAYCCNILLKKMICFGNRAINSTIIMPIYPETASGYIENLDLPYI